MIEKWERFQFVQGKAVKWEQSFDLGKTWQSVEWLGGELPFVLLNFSNMPWDEKICEKP